MARFFVPMDNLDTDEFGPVKIYMEDSRKDGKVTIRWFAEKRKRIVAEAPTKAELMDKLGL